LQRRVSTLAITLRSAASNTVYTVGEYSLRGATDLYEVQHLSERVIAQMQEIGRNLERAELEIIQSERLAAVGELAAGIAHELRNPLTSVKLLLQHAAIDEDQGAVSVSNMELILSEITRMESTIQGLLDFARPATLSCRIHDISIPLQRAITLVSGRAISNRVKIELRSSAGPLLVNGDIEQIHMVFVNLLINAVESIVSGGAITIETSSANAGRSVSATIRDTGCGIPEDVMKRLFEPFSTTKTRGTGLGLALCHRIVTNHHGTISGTNIPTGGAVFCVDFPCASSTESHSRIAELHEA
jgi:signal transduction histidine kinase